MGSRRSKKKSLSPNSTPTLQSQLEVPQSRYCGLLITKNLYISRLDTSLIASIASETKSFEEAKKILEPLAHASLSEEQFQRSLTYGSGAPISSEKEYIKEDTLSEAET